VEVLRVEHLNKEFGGIHAVRDITFKIDAGEHLAIIGPNGAGKTTLFNLLTGSLVPPVAKYSYMDGISHACQLTRGPPGDGRSFQVTSLFLNLTVEENALLSLNALQSSRYQVFKPVAGYRSLYNKAKSCFLLWTYGLKEMRRSILFPMVNNEN